jgi:hypothetical protein
MGSWSPSGSTPKTNNGLYRFLDTNGDGSGTKQAIGNYAGGEEFYIQPPAGQVYILARMMVQIRDAGPISADNYGGLAALTNGVSVDVKDASGSLLDLVDGLPVKTNAEWGAHCYDSEPDTYGSGNDYVSVRWTFEKGKHVIILRGDFAERFAVTLNDNLTGLVAHTFKVHGTWS